MCLRYDRSVNFATTTDQSRYYIDLGSSCTCSMRMVEACAGPLGRSGHGGRNDEVSHHHSASFYSDKIHKSHKLANHLYLKSFLGRANDLIINSIFTGFSLRRFNDVFHDFWCRRWTPNWLGRRESFTSVANVDVSHRKRVRPRHDDATYLLRLSLAVGGAWIVWTAFDVAIRRCGKRRKKCANDVSNRTWPRRVFVVFLRKMKKFFNLFAFIHPFGHLCVEGVLKTPILLQFSAFRISF